MAYSALPLRLSLDEAARLLQINPGHFHSGSADPIAYGPCSPGCESFWCESGWQQSNGLAREALAQALLQAELAITSLVGDPLTPERQTLIVRPQTTIDPYQGPWLSLKGHCGEVWPQQKEAIGTGVVTLVDADEDGYKETATITIVLATPPTENRLMLYAAEHAGDEEWRIRPWQRTVYDEGTGEYTIYISSLQVIRRELLLQPGCVLLSLLNDDIYLEDVELMQSIDDRTSAPANFIYERPAITCADPLCTACTEGVVPALVEYQERGERVRLWPATYDEEAEAWVKADRPACTCNGNGPASIVVDYYRSLSAPTPLSELRADLKWPIALLAAARMPIAKCDCECGTGQWFRTLQQDLAAVTGGGRYTTANRLNYPLGTLRGEQMAYDAIATALGWRAKTRAGIY